MHRLPLLAFLLVSVALLAAGSAGAGAGDDATEATAGAFGIQVVMPDGQVSSAAAIAAPPNGSASAESFVYAGGGVATGAIATEATATASGRADAIATASVQAVSLFGGEIAADAVAVKATGGASSRAANGSVALSSVSYLTVLGQPVQATSNARVPLADWGYAILLEQAVVREGNAAFGFRGTVTGLHVYLTAAHGGLPAGTEILIGYAKVGVLAAKPAPQPQPPPQPTPAKPPAEKPSAPETASKEKAEPQAKHPQREPVPQPPGAQAEPPAIVRSPPPDIRPQLTSGGFVFPVYGPSSFGDDFAAPRADTGWHHGNDIFAASGAPILAVADGELFLVGWNDIGGHRVWLRDDQGNEFYYAHLSAFSPIAFDGSRVRAGDVIGFVGTSGDADGTPPHLHFEIHPAQLRGLGYDGVVNPYEYLLAWRSLDDASFDVEQWSSGEGEAPPAAAVLLEANDISTASGLDPVAIDRVLAVPEIFDQGRFLLRRDPRAEILR